MTANEHDPAARVWDRRHRAILDHGDPDRSSQWLDPFLPLLTSHRCRDVMDLGCGTGYDALALARHGFVVRGIDCSEIAIGAAQRLADAQGRAVGFRLGDISRPLPCADGAFDAVISNLVLHCFTEAVLRRIVGEVDRCLRAGGLFLFHVNSTSDLERRLAVQPAECQLGPNCFVLAGGQTMRFFSGDHCAALLAGWSLIGMEPLTTTDPRGHPVKSVWRCAASKRI